MEKKFNTCADIIDASVNEISKELLSNYMQYTKAELESYRDILKDELDKLLVDYGKELCSFLPGKVVSAGWSTVNAVVEIAKYTEVEFDYINMVPMEKPDYDKIKMIVMVRTDADELPVGMKLSMFTGGKDKHIRWEPYIDRDEYRHHMYAKEEHRDTHFRRGMCCHMTLEDELHLYSFSIKSSFNYSDIRERIFKSGKFTRAVEDVFRSCAEKIITQRMKYSILNIVSYGMRNMEFKSEGSSDDWSVLNDVRDAGVLLSVLNNEFADTEIRLSSYGKTCELGTLMPADCSMSLGHYCVNSISDKNPDRERIVNDLREFIAKQNADVNGTVLIKGRDVRPNGNYHKLSNTIFKDMLVPQMIQAEADRFTAETLSGKTKTL